MPAAVGNVIDQKPRGVKREREKTTVGFHGVLERGVLSRRLVLKMHIPGITPPVLRCE